MQNSDTFDGLRVGIDIGSLFVKIAIFDAAGALQKVECRSHQGEILKVTYELIKDVIGDQKVAALKFVGLNSQPVADLFKMEPEDEVTATIRGLHQNHSDVRLIIDIGGGSLSLTKLSENGDFSGYSTNTLCAAGTGSFLDEQASRLGIEYSELDDLGFVEQPPSVAARCAVFAKSDLIHRQQEGCSKAEMWSGLCKGLVHTIVMTLFKGKKADGKTAVIGGVGLNSEVMRWLSKELGIEIVVPENVQAIAALGAALLAEPLTEAINWELLNKSEGNFILKARRPELKLKISNYPSFATEEEYIDEEENEVRVTKWPEDNLLRGYMGIDIGSTSTKLLLTNENDEAIVDIYRKTGGDPIGATKLLFKSLRTLVQNHKAEIDILGVGTTGSGRKLVGSVIGADAIINEITAHVKGALHTDPTIDSIFEIGGQDAKYIHAKNGHLHNSNMNYVCAAGTGSFIEELSRKLGFDLFTLGDEVMGVEPPVTSDRCTVFMEQDARMYMRRGFNRKEVMGAVMYSVVQNYLNKVVGNRYYSKKKIFFQGATARNKGLVAAFENLLNVEVVVSPYCHVMGSWGVALVTRKIVERIGKKSTFVGLDFAEKEVKLTQDTCTMCNNNCRITFAHVEGLDEKPSWGYLCGREPEEKHVRSNTDFSMFRKRHSLWMKAGMKDITLPKDAPVVGYPRALLTYNYYPMWQRFFAKIGIRLQLSKTTNHDIVEMSSDWVGADYCFPVKLAHGHVSYMIEKEKVEQVFLPYMISAGDKSGKTSESYFCPYNVSIPAMIGSAMELNGIDKERLFSATLDLRWNEKLTIKRLYADFKKRFDVSKKQIAEAWRDAWRTQTGFEGDLIETGREELQKTLESNRPAIVILGRAYNTFDPGANLSLPEKISKLGFPVVPLEFLPLKEENLGTEFDNMFWNYGRKILEAARFVARTPNLYAVYFSNFSCGPDSFIQTFVEEVMGDKPMLMLELDEHGADAGYITRLEAFADVIGGNETLTVPRYEFVRPDVSKEALGDKTLWVPPMAEGGTPFIAAAFRRHGYNSKPLPVETRESFLEGRANTRGGECVPCPATLGTFINAVKNSGNPPGKNALFMPTAEGPCRFGQYCTLDRMALDRMGWDDVPILSWRSEESYASDDSTLRRHLWNAFVFNDVLFKLRCRVVPYEVNKGQTEKTYEKWKERLTYSLEHDDKYEGVVEEMRQDFLSIPKHNFKKPLIGIVGEIYVRSNSFTNQNVIRRIEQAGGEAWLAPLSEWIFYLNYMEEWIIKNREGTLLNLAGVKIKNHFMKRDESYWMKKVSPILDDRQEPSIPDTLSVGEPYVPIDFEGETILTIGRAIEFMKNGASLVVNCAPFGCMPGLITSGIFQRVEQQYGVPVANMFYDGEGDINDIIDTYINNIINSNPEFSAARKEMELESVKSTSKESAPSASV